jgi:hypothetical protein
MATILIPNVVDAAYSSQKLRLEGRDYRFDFAYNQREDRWYLSIYDDEDDPLVTGLKIITSFPLLRRYQADPRVPPGELMAISLTGDDSPPGFSDFGVGRRVELTYFEAATAQELSA